MNVIVLEINTLLNPVDGKDIDIRVVTLNFTSFPNYVIVCRANRHAPLVTVLG